MSSVSLHKELKHALAASYSTITEFAANLEKPDGSVGVSHTAVIRTAQGKDVTPWIVEAIENKIEQAKNEYPKYYSKKHLQTET